jgi:hypothetical protein
LYSSPNKAFKPGSSSFTNCARDIAIVYPYAFVITN